MATIGFTGVILLFLLFLLTLLYLISKKIISKEYIEDQKGIMSWIIVFAILFILLKYLPSSLMFSSLRLKSLYNLLDLLGLFITLFFIIIRVTSIQESKKPKQKRKRGIFRLFNWWGDIPLYCKIIFILYIPFISFYLSLESYTVSFLLNVPFYIVELKLEFLTMTLSVGIFYAFWKYSPIKVPFQGPGPIKIFKAELEKKKEKKMISQKEREMSLGEYSPLVKQK